MNIVKFWGYSKENFGVNTWSDKVKDNRKRPQIQTVQAFESMCQMPALGQKSFLEWDEFARTAEARKWHGSDRNMVASDTTLGRIAEGMERASVQTICYDVIDKADEQALWDLTLPSKKKIRFGIVDGHYAGGVWVSVLGISGKTDGVVDLERYAGRGHELSATRQVLKRAFRKLGKGFFGIVAGDGLYANHHDFKLCLTGGSHLLVKTDEENITAIQDARHLFTCRDSKELQGISRAQGLDHKRNIEYDVTWLEGIEWYGLKMTVAWVKEHDLKPEKGRPEYTGFWVMTTATGLTGEDLRELAHLRWEIENNIFKRLNHLVESKRRWSHKPKVMEMMLRAWMIGLTLLGIYLVERGWNIFEQTWGAMKKTWRAVTNLMRASLFRLCT